MKRMIAMLLALSCLPALFAGCAKEAAYQKTEVEGVSIGITDVSPSGATVIIKDTGKEQRMYGQWYKIEKETNGQWNEVKTVIDNYGFDLVGYLPDNNNEIKFAIDWKWLYGELPAGKYRLLKKAEQKVIFVEFEI